VKKFIDFIALHKMNTFHWHLTAYTAANGITAVKHSSGMYYQIMDPGTGAVPNLNSKVSVTYSGKLLNGTQFDQSLTPISLYLSQVIGRMASWNSNNKKGWKNKVDYSIINGLWLQRSRNNSI